MKKWYVVSTKYNQENLALKNLVRQSILTYYPKLYKKKVIKSNFLQDSYSAFFPGYVFVSLDIEKGRWRAVNSTIGVKKILSFGSFPVPVPEKIICELRKSEDEKGVIRYNDQFSKGDNVIIDAGLFVGIRGKFDSYISGAERVKVLLSFMGIISRINIESSLLSKA